MKNVIIAEKPSVGREYARILGVTGDGKGGFIENDKWIVTWTVGHLVSMSYPEKYDETLKKWELTTLPFIPDKFKYEVIKEVVGQYKTVKQIYNRQDISAIYYAGDSGREGLYIQMLVRMLAGHNPSAKELVVWIDSQTESEVLRGIFEAKDVKEYDHMKDAGFMRAIEDYLVGINFSRLLSIKYGTILNSASAQKKYKPIAVGRVMTCVLGMIVRREHEILNFKPQTFYRIKAKINQNDNEVICDWKAVEGSKYYNSPLLYSEFGFLKESDANNFIATLSNDAKIEDIKKTNESKKAPLLYNLAELQSDCSKRLHISPAQTLEVAQSLYEKKLTTYPRTDARVLSSAVAAEIDKNISGLSGGEYDEYVSEIKNNRWQVKGKYVDDSKITDHYAIIPTGNAPSGLTDREKTVYDMIVRRFLSIFYPGVSYEKVSITLAKDTEKFFGAAKYITDEGFYKVTGVPKDEINSPELVNLISSLMIGQTVATTYETAKGETKPPARYTSGSIILAMENAGNLIEDEELREQIKGDGIGTSATRADVIEKLIKQNYIEINDKTQVLTPAIFGEMIFRVVEVTLPDMLVPEMTAKWEHKLDEICNGLLTRDAYEKELKEYVKAESEKIKALDNADDIIKLIYPYATGKIIKEYKAFESYNTKIKCPLCGDDIETTAWGFRCKSNKGKDGGCAFSIGDLAGHRLLTDELYDLLVKGSCGPFHDFTSKKGRPFAAELKWNKETKKIDFELVDLPWTDTDLKCPACGGKLQKQITGAFMCENAPNKCDFLIRQIAGKVISEAQIKKLVNEGRTDVISGFKNKDDKKFDGMLVWNRAEKKIDFDFPDGLTNLMCPICGGQVLSGKNGFRCERFHGFGADAEGNCTFFVGTFLGHKVKEKELTEMLKGKDTEPVKLKNQDKEFLGKLYWNEEEKRLSVKFVDTSATDTKYKCPICGGVIKSGKYGFFCEGKEGEGCSFRYGDILGVAPEEKHLAQLLSSGRTEPISGFKSTKKGKNGTINKFTASLVWDAEEGKLTFDFQNDDDKAENTSIQCPACKEKRLKKGVNRYFCDCGFAAITIVAEKVVDDNQMKKLFLTGSTDLISGFYSKKTRRKFSAKLVLSGDKITFDYPERK